LRNANLNRAQMPLAELNGVHFEGADLTDANIAGALNIVNMNVNEGTTLCRTRMFNGEAFTNQCRSSAGQTTKQAH
jgi:uncharacterized protein YjbI with pentapeptide repeats